MNAGLGVRGDMNFRTELAVRQAFQRLALNASSGEHRLSARIEKIGVDLDLGSGAAFSSRRKNRPEHRAASNRQLILPVDQLIVFDDGKEIGEAPRIDGDNILAGLFEAMLHVRVGTYAGVLSNKLAPV